MLHLRNFLRCVTWGGDIPGQGKVAAMPAELAMGRRERLLIQAIADRLPSRGWESGVKGVDKKTLAGGMYEPSSVRAALCTLRRAGLVTTQRVRHGKTGLEGYSTAFIEPGLVTLAKRWQNLRSNLKKAKSDRKKEINHELTQMQKINLPFLYVPPANPHEQRLADHPMSNFDNDRCQKIATINTIHTPQPSAGGVLALAVQDVPAFMAVPLPLSLDPPPHCPQGQGGCDLPAKLPVEDDSEAEGVARGDVKAAAAQIFERNRLARAGVAAGRLEIWKKKGLLVEPWQPDARPRLQEWQEIDQDAPGSRRLVNCAHITFFEIRAFQATLDQFNRHADGHTSLCLVRPGQDGRMPVFKNKTWGEIDFEKAFNFAWAKSNESFENNKTGEQLFAIPGEKSRLVLLDDMKSPEPIFENTLCVILETSLHNYQHLYCCDKVLTGAERHSIQSAIQARFGGDKGATGGAQPHRVPGSVNYKPGRNLFVCRLVGTISAGLDCGKPLKSADWLQDVQLEDVPSDALPATQKQKREANRMIKINVATGAGDGDKSPSGQDWRRAILLCNEMRGCRHDEIDKSLTNMLIKSASARGKNDPAEYSKLTVSKLLEAGHF